MFVLVGWMDGWIGRLELELELGLNVKVAEATYYYLLACLLQSGGD